MKRSIIIILIFLFGFCTGLIGQKINEGVYLSANDFKNGKISYADNHSKEKYKLYLNEIINTSLVKIIKGDSIILLKKDSIFGYRDEENNCYRFYNKNAYRIINPSERILLYSRISLDGVPKYSHFVTNYYFSVNINSPLYPLTKKYLKEVLFNDVLFNVLLEVYFKNDNELIEYDKLNKIYILNHLYELSKKQAINLTDNNLIKSI